MVASGSGDGKITLWDIASGLRLTSTNGHLDWVMCLAFSPDGRYLASGSADNTVVIWNVTALLNPDGADDSVWLQITDFSSRVWSVAFSPDGRKFAASTQDGQIRLWNMDADTWPDRACRRANRNLSRDEWTRFVGLDIPYHPCSSFSLRR
ncbi:MAG TPA: hypothetical protein P5526_27130 [Anaerolineae bacterium]|nr:hypothetical protein [Anaerolineae bacterium]